MIRYALKCTQGHQFESWFQSADAFDRLSRSGHVHCAVCGSGEVEKAVMAPRVQAVRKAAQAPEERTGGELRQSNHPAEQALSEMRRKVEETADYVGGQFASEARAIHHGDAPERPIWGEARTEEARKLVEDGVPVMPLPFVPTRKAN